MTSFKDFYEYIKEDEIFTDVLPWSYVIEAFLVHRLCSEFKPKATATEMLEIWDKSFVRTGFDQMINRVTLPRSEWTWEMN